MPAQARVDYMGGAALVAAAGTFVYNTGNIATIVRTGLGVYEVGLNAPMASDEHVGIVQVISATAAMRTANLETVSAALWRVRGVVDSGDGVVAADIDFYIEADRVRTAH